MVAMGSDQALTELRERSRDTLRRSFRELAARSKAPRIRSIREFAEQEIVLSPTSPHPGRYSVARQPFAAHWFDLIDDTKPNPYVERVAMGPSQSGKTLQCFVIPLMYHLFEMRETVVAAVPDADMISDKWEKDIEPAISRSRFRDLMPAVGGGSRGGKFKSITFKNGQTLRFMSAHGDDKSVAGFTTRVICFTETDGFERQASTSAESDKIKQIEARCRSYELRRRRIYKECTITTATAHTWAKYESGTNTKIVLPCPYCREWVTPERANFLGWQDTLSEVEATERAHFACPACAHPWSEADRAKANKASKVIHRGQTIDQEGVIHGEHPHTFTLGFRWSAVNNLLVPAGDFALEEHRALNAVNEDSAERELCQFIWAVPYVAKDLDEVAITAETINRRVVSYGRGQVPEDTQWTTVGIDVGKYVLHWVAMCWRSNGTGHVLDYGTQGVRGRELGFGKAIARAIGRIRETLGNGWTHAEVDRVLVDSRYKTSDVVAAIKALKSGRWKPAMGLGKGHWSKRAYVHPESIGGRVTWVGNACYEKLLVSHKATFMFADANSWKTLLHESLSIDLDPETKQAQPGGISLFSAMDAKTHATYRKHLTAEKEKFEFQAGVGQVRVWEALRSENHFLDATYLACVAGHRCGYSFAGIARARQAGQQASTIAIDGHSPGWDESELDDGFSPFE